MRRTFVLLVSIALAAVALVSAEDLGKPSLDIGVGVDGAYDAYIGFYNKDTGSLLFKDGPFSLVGTLSVSNDGKYAPTTANTASGSIGGYYFFIEEGGLSYDSKNFSMKVGRFRHYDQIDSPYSLFVNSNGIAANLGQLRYENERFIYETRWVELNRNSDLSTPTWNKADSLGAGFPDRGVNLKTIALKFGDMRVGYQDAIVYSGRSFDLEYFANPIPCYFIQYLKGQDGRPWSSGQNDNTLMGLFWDLTRADGSRYYAQFLVDDFYIPKLSKYLYPQQMAWALGGSWKTNYGTFGVHHGGAFKYTFQSNTVNKDDSDARAMAYGYNYYPDTSYYSDGTTVVAIDITDNSFGFKYGENTAAFQVDWQNRVYDTFIKAAMELVLAGSNSSENPWHEAASEEGLPTALLNDSVLQKTVSMKVNAARKFGDLDVSLAMKLGYIFNVLELASPSNVSSTSSTVDKNSLIFYPSQDNKWIFNLTLGIRYVFKTF